MSSNTPQRTLQEYAASSLGRPEDTYFYQVLPLNASQDEIRFAVTSSDDHISQVSLNEKAFIGQSSVSSQHRNITRIALLRKHVITAGDDGKIRVIAFENQTMKCALPGRPGKSISALACDLSSGLVAAGTASEKEGAGDVEIYLWQVLDRSTQKFLSAPKLLRTYTESHMDTITELAFMHLSSDEIRLVSASTDGLVNVFNPNIEDEDDAVEEAINNKSPIHYMTLVSPQMDGGLHSVFVISGDERMMLYQIGEGCSAISNEVDIRETFQCDYTVKITTTSQGRVNLVTGAYKTETTSSPNINVWDVSQDNSGQGVSLLASFEGAHGDEVVRDVWWHDDFSVAVSGGEDGHVRAWRASEQARATAQQGTSKTKKSPSQEGSGGSNKKDVRFRPY